MVVDNFRTSSHLEASFTYHHLHIMRYSGDNLMDFFYNRWTDILNNMDLANKPTDKLLEETLYRKIEHSQLMKFDLSRYESTIEGDKDRSYKYLIDMIRKHVKKKIGDQFLKAKEKAVMNFVGNPKATPAEGSDEDPPKKPNPKPKAKPAPGGNPKGGKTGKDGDLAPATPVYPTAAPKSHGKPKGNGKEGRSQSPDTRDRKKMYCVFHFEKNN